MTVIHVNFKKPEDAKERTRLTNAAHDAWTEYVQFLRAEGAAEEADYRADMLREDAA